MDTASEPEPIDSLPDPPSFSEKLYMALEEIECLAGNPEQAPWALYKTLCAIRALRWEAHLLDKKSSWLNFTLNPSLRKSGRP